MFEDDDVQETGAEETSDAGTLPATKPADGSVYGEVEDRAAALIRKMKAADLEAAKAADAADDDDPDDVEEEAEEAEEVEEAAPKPAAKKAKGAAPAEPQSRLAKLAAEERERRKAYAERSSEERSYSQRMAELDRRERELRERESVWDNPSALLETLEKRVGGEKLGEWIVQQNDPTRKAAAETLAAVSPELAKLKEFAARYEEEQRNTRAQREIEQTESIFKDEVAKYASDAPRLARAMAKNARKALDRAHAKAQHLTAKGQEFTLFDIMAHLEADYEEDGAYGAEDASPPATDKTTKANRSVTAKIHGKKLTDGVKETRRNGSSGSLQDRIAAAERFLRNT